MAHQRRQLLSNTHTANSVTAEGTSWTTSAQGKPNSFQHLLTGDCWGQMLIGSKSPPLKGSGYPREIREESQVFAWHRSYIVCCVLQSSLRECTIKAGSAKRDCACLWQEKQVLKLWLSFSFPFSRFTDLFGRQSSRERRKQRKKESLIHWWQQPGIYQAKARSFFQVFDKGDRGPRT